MTHKAELQALLDASIEVAASFTKGADGWMGAEIHFSDYKRLQDGIDNALASLKKDGQSKPDSNEIVSKIEAKLEAEAEKSPKWSEHNLLQRIAKEIREGDY